MVFQRFSYVSEDMNNKTQQRRQFTSTQSGSQGTCFMGGGGGEETTGVECCQEYLRQTAASSTTRVNRPPAQRSARTTYLALPHAL